MQASRFLLGASTQDKTPDADTDRRLADSRIAVRATEVDQPAQIRAVSGTKPFDKFFGLPVTKRHEEPRHRSVVARVWALLPQNLQELIMKASSPLWRLWNAYNSSLKARLIRQLART